MVSDELGGKAKEISTVGCNYTYRYSPYTSMYYVSTVVIEKQLIPIVNQIMLKHFIHN